MAGIALPAGAHDLEAQPGGRGDDGAIAFVDLIRAHATAKRLYGVATERDRSAARQEGALSAGDVPMVGEFASAQAIDAGERESVVARFTGTGGGRSLIFFAHPDGEPVAGTERWKRDPFAGVVEGGRIHGWGAADDLCGVAIMIEGLRAALAQRRRAGRRRDPGQHAQQAPCARRVGIAAWRAARRRRGLSPPCRVGRRHARDQGVLPRPARLPHDRAGHAATDQRDQPSRLHASAPKSRRSR